MHNAVVPRAKTKGEIAVEMGISISTLQRKLKLAGLVIPRGLIAPEEQKEIYEKLRWGVAP